MGIFALAAVVACSHNDEENKVNQPVDGANKSYLALNGSTCVGDKEKVASRLADAVYEDGTADEQAVTEATFYFFDAAGNIFPVNANGNYYNVSVADNGGKETPNIESMTDPVIVIEKYKGEFPAQVVAVVNYKGTASLSLSQLKDNMQAAGHTNGKNFIMTNSVYVDGSGAAVYATPLTIDHFQTSADKALASPVTIYVERMTAKMSVVIRLSMQRLSVGMLSALRLSLSTSRASIRLGLRHLWALYGMTHHSSAHIGLQRA